MAEAAAVVHLVHTVPLGQQEMERLLVAAEAAEVVRHLVVPQAVEAPQQVQQERLERKGQAAVEI